MLFYQFVEVAKKEARKSPIKHKYGAVIVHKGKIVSKGYNTSNGFPPGRLKTQCVL